MKFSERWNWDELRHKLVLTPEEKRVIGFVVAGVTSGIVVRFIVVVAHL